MSVIEIRQAQREGARLVIGLAGVSGCGKTYTAIMLAYGLTNYDASKIGFLDTENRRGSLYADILQTANPPTNTPFLIGDLVAPFSPQRYIDAIAEFQRAGVEVLIVDSISHEHEGPGGLMDIAGEANKFWNRAKYEHKKFVNALLQSDMHIIVCVRAREKVALAKVKDETTGKMKTDYQDEGLQPVTEKNLMFEMTASLMMHDEGSRQTKLKCPSALLPVLGRENGYITPADGAALRAWVDGAKQLDPTVEKFRNRLLSNCEKGVAHIKSCWTQTPAAIQEALGDKFRATLEASAKAYDDAKEAAESNDAPSSQTASQGGASAIAASAIAAAASAGRTARAEAAPKAETKPAAAETQETVRETPAAVTETKPAKDETVKPAAAAKPVAAKDLPIATPAAAKKATAPLAEPMF